jgi:hypothetical protein
LDLFLGSILTWWTLNPLAWGLNTTRVCGYSGLPTPAALLLLAPAALAARLGGLGFRV